MFQSYNGVQCTTIALIVLISFAYVLDPSRPLSEVPRESLDRLLLEGTQLYAHISDNRRMPGGYLSHRDLPQNLPEFFGESRTVH